MRRDDADNAKDSSRNNPIGTDDKKNRLPTLADVARKLGISRTTVSLVVSDHPRISAKTKAAVWRCIDELGYRPDPMARALATGRSNLIGLVVPATSNPFFAEIFRGRKTPPEREGITSC